MLFRSPQTTAAASLPPFTETHTDGTVTSINSESVHQSKPTESTTPIDDFTPVHRNESTVEKTSVQEQPSPYRRSTRANKGTFQSTKYIDESYMTSFEDFQRTDPYINHLAYLAEVATCCDAGIENVIDPRVYAAKTQGSDPDSPTFHQAMAEWRTC